MPAEMEKPAKPEGGRRPMRDLPLTRLIPNMLTMLSLCAGLTAMRFALQDRWAEAALTIVIASVLDVLDGRVARLLNIASKFGAELDSLADLTSFGVAPAFMMYLWLFKDDETGIGWIAVMVFAVCSALRLARFNTMLEDLSAPKWTKSFFTGVPAPAGAGLALLPLFFVLQFGEALRPHPLLMAIWMIVAGGLMVSRVPTLSMKNRRIAPIFVAPLMMGVCLLVAGLLTRTWFTLCLLGALYVALLPYGWISYYRRQKQEGSKL